MTKNMIGCSIFGGHKNIKFTENSLIDYRYIAFDKSIPFIKNVFICVKVLDTRQAKIIDEFSPKSMFEYDPITHKQGNYRYYHSSLLQISPVDIFFTSPQYTSIPENTSIFKLEMNIVYDDKIEHGLFGCYDGNPPPYDYIRTVCVVGLINEKTDDEKNGSISFCNDLLL